MVLPQHTQHAFLPMPTAELVAYDWVSVEAGLDVGPLQALAGRAHNGHLIHNGCFTGLVLAGPASSCNSSSQLMLMRIRQGSLTTSIARTICCITAGSLSQRHVSVMSTLSLSITRAQ